MQSNITQLKTTRFFRAALIVFSFFCFVSGGYSQTYVNSNLSTGATTSGGTAAPAGYTWSEVQLGNTNAGFNASITQGAFRVGDDFVVPAGPSWTITGMTFYGYQTNYAGATSPFNTIRIQIHSGSITGPVVFGDMTTNRFVSSADAMMYRIFNNAPNTARKIWTIESAVNVTLAPGTYWIEWATDVVGGAGHFLPNSTIVGQVTQPGYNAQSLTVATNTWAPALDGANQQDMVFRINYTTSACGGTPSPGNTIASAPAVCPGTPVTLSLQNNTPGSGVTYQWQSAPALAGPYTNIPGATNPTYNTNITATTYFQAVVTCGANSGTSVPTGVTLNTPSQCYCIPPASDCTDGDIITNVTLLTLNNPSTCNSPSGYSNFTTGLPVPSLVAGSTNAMSVTAGGGLFTEHVAVWIDYNQSGTFEASEFRYFGSTTGGTLNSTVIVPTTATLGEARMRVRVRYNTTLAGGDACLGYVFGETEDYTVNIVPCVQGVITTQPAATTIACGANGTISVAATGSALSYVWEYRTSPTGPWLLVPNAAPYSGITTNTLTITNAPSTISGYQYRVVMSGPCTATDFSSAATLTVSALTPSLNTTLPINRCNTAAPSLISILNSSGATTTVSFASAPALNIPIPDNGSTAAVSNTQNVTTIPAGASITGLSVRLNITHSWVGDLILVLRAPNGQIFNLDAALGATGGPGPSTGFTNTVISSTGVNALNTGVSPYTATFRADARMTPMNLAPYTNVQPGPTGFIPTTALWSDLYSTANGNWTLALYDYYQDDLAGNMLVNWTLNVTYGTLATGTFTPTTGLFTDAAGTVAYTGGAVNAVYANPATSTNYSLVVSTPSCTSAPLTVPVNVSTALSGVSVNGNQATCFAGSASFTVSATAGNLQTIVWQVSTDGGNTWTAVANGGIYSGATSPTLTITGAPLTASGNLYRAVVSNSCNSQTSGSSSLSVNPNPVIVVSSNPFSTLTPGMTTILSAAVSPNAGVSYQWYRNGVLIPGATAPTYTVDVDGFGDYTVTVTDVNGCTSSSSSISVTDQTSDIVFIYPSPNTGQFQVRYHSQAGNVAVPRLLNVYDSKGSRVFSRTYTIGAPYERMDVDLRSHGKGIYQVELSDQFGNRLKTGRVVVL